MYLEHFGLKEFPFSITPDTEFFFPSGSAREALNTMLVAVKTGEGFVKITGEVGTGKSMLCRQLISILSADFKVAYLLNPFLEPETLVVQIAVEIGAMRDHEVLSKAQVLMALNARLLQIHRGQQRVLVCLDEAQAMPIETLEALRLLSNLETEKRKLLQVIIFGQPELDDKLNHRSIRQLKQRIGFEYRLAPLSSNEVAVYLRHRLSVAGCTSQVFSSWAVWLLARCTQRVPRLMNIIAHKSLLSAFGKGAQKVGLLDVLAAVNDTVSIKLNPTRVVVWIVGMWMVGGAVWYVVAKGWIR